LLAVDGLDGEVTPKRCCRAWPASAAATWFFAGGDLLRQEPKAILVDLDGTLSDPAHRTHNLHSTPPDWKSFSLAASRDAPKVKQIAWLDHHYLDHSVIVVSGRPSYSMDLTLAWLALHHVRWNLIALRPDGDVVRGLDHKLRVLSALRKLGFVPKLAIDDSVPVRVAYMAEGLPCLPPVD
jgi:hypothetical protein